MGQNVDDDEEGSPRRFELAVLIRHPTLHPREITAALGSSPQVQQIVGEPRQTPKGTPLPGTYKRTVWRYGVRHEVRNQWFAKVLTEFVDSLVPHRDFLHHLRSTGGDAILMLEFLGDAYLGDDIPSETLAKLADLRLELGLEVFMVPQS